jgi:hypothetical protein
MVIKTGFALWAFVAIIFVGLWVLWFFNGNIK